MGRSLKKGPHVDLRLLAKVERQGMNKDPIKTWSRDCTVVPEFIGRRPGMKSFALDRPHPVPRQGGGGVAGGKQA